MIARRRWPSTASPSGDTHTPESSGPRCATASVSAPTMAASTPSQLPNTPAMPHMFSRSESGRQRLRPADPLHAGANQLRGAARNGREPVVAHRAAISGAGDRTALVVVLEVVAKFVDQIVGAAIAGHFAIERKNAPEMRRAVADLHDAVRRQVVQPLIAESEFVPMDVEADLRPLIDRDALSKRQGQTPAAVSMGDVQIQVVLQPEVAAETESATESAPHGYFRLKHN